MMRIYSMCVLEAAVPLETIMTSSISLCKKIGGGLIYKREREREIGVWCKIFVLRWWLPEVSGSHVGASGK